MTRTSHIQSDRQAAIGLQAGLWSVGMLCLGYMLSGIATENPKQEAGR